jgi:hypothetical protein
MHQIILKSGIVLDIGVQTMLDKVVSNMKEGKDTLLENNGNTIFFIVHTEIAAIKYDRYHRK